MPQTKRAKIPKARGQSNARTPQSHKKDIQWLRAQLETHGIKQIDIAARLNLDPSSTWQLLYGVRKIQMEEAVELAQIFSVPLDEFLARVGIKPPATQGRDTITVRGWVDGNLVVHWETPQGARTAPKPAFTRDLVHVLRFQTQGSKMDGMDGAFVYYMPMKGGVDPNSLGRLCIVEPREGNLWRLAVPKRGYTPGSYTLISMSGVVLEENVFLKSASPVVWLKI